MRIRPLRRRHPYWLNSSPSPSYSRSWWASSAKSTLRRRYWGRAVKLRVRRRVRLRRIPRLCHSRRRVHTRAYSCRGWCRFTRYCRHWLRCLRISRGFICRITLLNRAGKSRKPVIRRLRERRDSLRRFKMCSSSSTVSIFSSSWVWSMKPQFCSNMWHSLLPFLWMKMKMCQISWILSAWASWVNSIILTHSHQIFSRMIGTGGT